VRNRLYDCDSWNRYPQHRRWFNKLDLSLRLGYECGPCGLAPSKTAQYVVRPIYNLSGMSAGARYQTIESGDAGSVEPGYFWCERFVGPHVSVNYESNGAYWFQTGAWTGHRSKNSTSRFEAWTTNRNIFRLPELFNTLLDVTHLNVEYIDKHIIEVHLRKSSDPECEVLIPVWADDTPEKINRLVAAGFNYFAREDDADGFLTTQRKGFLTHESYDSTKLLVHSLLVK